MVDMATKPITDSRLREIALEMMTAATAAFEAGEDRESEMLSGMASNVRGVLSERERQAQLAEG